MNSLLKFKWALFISLILIQACNSDQPKTSIQNDSVTTINEQKDIITANNVLDTSKITKEENNISSIENKTKKEQPTILIYNFHVTNRCASCVAIEEATTKTLNTYFSDEIKKGIIKRQILNVDDEANSTIAEKYQAFGSGMFITRIFNKKENTTDLTGDGFKYAKNKEERFIEILKTKITEYLK